MNGIAADPKVVVASLVRANPELTWCDTSRRGYMALTIASDRISNDWIMVDTVKQRSGARASATAPSCCAIAMCLPDRCCHRSHAEL